MADLNEEQLIKKQKILESGLDIAEETIDKLITAEDSQLAIDEYIQGNIHNHDPKAPRKLLLHRKEIEKLKAFTQAKGYALVPLKMYWKKGKVKVLLGVGQGKNRVDKREDLRKRDTDRQMRNAMMRQVKGR